MQVYAVEQDYSIISKWNVDLEKEMIDTAAKQLARDIDKEILDTLMIDVLTSEGWVGTKVNPAVSQFGMTSVPLDDWYSKTAEWIHLNATDDYKLLRGQWFFKNPKDATMFILKCS